MCATHTIATAALAHQKLVFATTTTVHVRGTRGDRDEFYF
jgi:hypothetical protein